MATPWPSSTPGRHPGDPAGRSTRRPEDLPGADPPEHRQRRQLLPRGLVEGVAGAAHQDGRRPRREIGAGAALPLRVLAARDGRAVRAMYGSVVSDTGEVDRNFATAPQVACQDVELDQCARVVRAHTALGRHEGGELVTRIPHTERLSRGADAHRQQDDADPDGDGAAKASWGPGRLRPEPAGGAGPEDEGKGNGEELRVVREEDRGHQ